MQRDTSWIAILAMALLLAAAVVPAASGGVCATDENTAECLREWLQALATAVFAAASAGIAGYFGYADWRMKRTDAHERMMRTLPYESSFCEDARQFMLCSAMVLGLSLASKSNPSDVLKDSFAIRSELSKYSDNVKNVDSDKLISSLTQNRIAIQNTIREITRFLSDKGDILNMLDELINTDDARRNKLTASSERLAEHIATYEEALGRLIGASSSYLAGERR